jgi:predicted HAD superfamily Cof-like phosphohydrolase
MSEHVNSKWVGDMVAMHTKFGVNPVVREFDQTKARAFLEFRIKFLKEELDEMQKALDDFDAGNIDAITAADDIVDAAIDLCVVAIGTLDAYDVNADEAWNRVWEKNMEKEVGVKASRPNPLGLPDLVKPEGWTAPTHRDNIGALTKVFQ